MREVNLGRDRSGPGRGRSAGNADHSPWSADFSYDPAKNILTVITSDYRNIPAELRNQELRFEWVSRFDDEILVPANPADTPTLTLDGGEGDDQIECGGMNVRHTNDVVFRICRIFHARSCNESEWRMAE